MSRFANFAAGVAGLSVAIMENISICKEEANDANVVATNGAHLANKNYVDFGLGVMAHASNLISRDKRRKENEELISNSAKCFSEAFSKK